MNEIVRFKGDRLYVHATDELLTAEPLLEGTERFTFTARQVGTCVARWFDTEETVGDDWEAIARLVVETRDGGRKVYECRQELARPITDSVEFDENELIKEAVKEEKSLRFIPSFRFTLWEYLSTLQKILLQNVIGHQQWYFVRLKLDCSGYIHDFDYPVEMILRYYQQKGPLYISEIMIGDSVVGEIAYSKR